MLNSEQLAQEERNHANRRNGFTFRGEHSSDYFLFVEKYPEYKIPKRKRTTVRVPGRSGDLHIEEGGYENTPAPYVCYFHSMDPMPEALGMLTGWLNQSGYWRLEDEYDKNHFRMASFAGPADVGNHLNKYGRCTIQFDCKPQRYLKSGETTYSYSSATYINNPTRFPAKPFITVYGTGAGNLTVGNTTVQILSLSDQVTLDCETQNAYRQPGQGGIENKNSTISAPVFPELAPGNNLISWTGRITSVRITPRWWTL